MYAKNKNAFLCTELRDRAWGTFADSPRMSLRVQVPLRTGRSVLMRSSPLSKAERSFNADFCWHIYSAPQKYLPNVLPPMAYRARFEFKLLWISEAFAGVSVSSESRKVYHIRKAELFPADYFGRAGYIILSRGEFSISFSLFPSLFLSFLKYHRHQNASSRRTCVTIFLHSSRARAQSECSNLTEPVSWHFHFKYHITAAKHPRIEHLEATRLRGEGRRQIFPASGRDPPRIQRFLFFSWNDTLSRSWCSAVFFGVFRTSTGFHDHSELRRESTPANTPIDETGKIRRQDRSTSDKQTAEPANVSPDDLSSRSHIRFTRCERERSVGDRGGTRSIGHSRSSIVHSRSPSIVHGSTSSRG